MLGLLPEQPGRGADNAGADSCGSVCSGVADGAYTRGERHHRRLGHALHLRRRASVGTYAVHRVLPGRDPWVSGQLQPVAAHHATRRLRATGSRSSPGRSRPDRSSSARRGTPADPWQSVDPAAIAGAVAGRLAVCVGDLTAAGHLGRAPRSTPACRRRWGRAGRSSRRNKGRRSGKGTTREPRTSPCWCRRRSRTTHNTRERSFAGQRVPSSPHRTGVAWR